MKNFFARPSLAAAVISGAAVLIALLGSWTLVRAEGGTISICVKNNGKVSVGTSCGTGDTLLTWNIQGPQGPEGPQGPQGIQGIQGPSGSGIARADIYQETASVLLPPHTFGETFAECHDDDDVLLTGGFDALSGFLRVTRSQPLPFFPHQTWVADALNVSDVEATLHVNVVCLRVGS